MPEPFFDSSASEGEDEKKMAPNPQYLAWRRSDRLLRGWMYRKNKNDLFTRTSLEYISNQSSHLDSWSGESKNFPLSKTLTASFASRLQNSRPRKSSFRKRRGPRKNGILWRTKRIFHHCPCAETSNSRKRSNSSTPFVRKRLLHITELFAPDEPLHVLFTVEKGQDRGLLSVVF